MDVVVAFAEMPWEHKAPGLRVKAVECGGKQIRLVEFSPEFQEPDWCTRGHSGIVLEGELHLSVNGSVMIYRAGDGITLPPGEATRHRHVTGSPRALLFLVEDI